MLSFSFHFYFFSYLIEWTNHFVFVKGTRAVALETQVQLSCFQSNFLFILPLCKQMMATTQTALRGGCHHLCHNSQNLLPVEVKGPDSSCFSFLLFPQYQRRNNMITHAPNSSLQKWSLALVREVLQALCYKPEAPIVTLQQDALPLSLLHYRQKISRFS